MFFGARPNKVTFGANADTKVSEASTAQTASSAETSLAVTLRP